MCVIPPNQQPCIPFQLPCWTANMDVGWSHVFSRTKQMDMGHRDALIFHPLPQLLFCPLLWQAVDIEATMVHVGHVSQSTWFCWKLSKVVTVVCFKFCVFSFVSVPLILSGVLESCESYGKALWCSIQKLIVVVVVVVSYLWIYIYIYNCECMCVSLFFHLPTFAYTTAVGPERHSVWSVGLNKGGTACKSNPKTQKVTLEQSVILKRLEQGGNSLQK